jgi:DNA-binding transcriptional regulator LsrR (DeoR family)
MKEKNLTQSQLARELGVSRVRVTQMLNLLTLPIEQQNYILEHGKEKFITERSLRRLVAAAKQESILRKNG